MIPGQLGIMGLELDELIALNAAYQLATARTLAERGGAYDKGARENGRPARARVDVARDLWECAVTVLGPQRARALAEKLDLAARAAETCRPVGLG